MEQSGTDVGSVRAHRITSQAKWTFLVYMAGANNLDGAALSEANKGFNKVEHLKDNVARFHDHNILVVGGIIFGFDTDTRDAFDRTIEALKKVRIDSVAVNILIPYPGTEFYRRFEREGRIICTDCSKYTGGTVIVRPKNMTVEELQKGYNRFTKGYYHITEMVYRAFKQPNAVTTITMFIAKCGAQSELFAGEITTFKMNYGRQDPP